MELPDPWTVVMTGVMLTMALAMLLSGALMLKLVVRLLEGFPPPYLRTLCVVFLASLVAFVFHLVLSLASARMGVPVDGQPSAPVDTLALVWVSLGVLAASAVVALLANAWFLDRLLRHPDGRRIGLARAGLASLLTLLGVGGLGLFLSMVLGLVLALWGLDPALLAD